MQIRNLKNGEKREGKREKGIAERKEEGRGGGGGKGKKKEQEE